MAYEVWYYERSASPNQADAYFGCCGHAHASEAEAKECKRTAPLARDLRAEVTETGAVSTNA